MLVHEQNTKKYNSTIGWVTKSSGYISAPFIRGCAFPVGSVDCESSKQWSVADVYPYRRQKCKLMIRLLLAYIVGINYNICGRCIMYD